MEALTMVEPNNFWYRILFKIKLYEANGAAFQQFVNQLFDYSIEDFQSISPWGNWGDGGNDGWIPSKGHYYQIYGPKPNTKLNELQTVKKLIDDYNKLTDKWRNVISYYFVLNDRYTGVPAPVVNELQQLELESELQEARAIGSANLEKVFIELSNDCKELIVGGIPNGSPDFIDSRCVGELLSHIADKPTNLPGFLNETAPIFEEKIKFNGITSPVSDYLKLYSYHVAAVDDFLAVRDPGLKQEIAQEINRLYNESKLAIPDSESEAPNMRYVWMVDQLIPKKMKNNVHSMKAYREASQVILTKYFETCDAYENPNSSSTT